MSGLLAVGAALVVLGCASSTYFVIESGGGAVGYAFRAYQLRLERHTSFLLLRLGGPYVARLQLVGVACLSSLFFITRSMGFALLAFAAAALPPLFRWKRHAARVAMLERQLDTWLLMLANALKATSSLGEAIASTAALVPRPFSEEVDLLAKEVRLGVPLSRALGQTAGRIGSPAISGAIMMIAIARQTGGDLSKTLERAAAGLRENARLEGVLRTKTAEGRGQVLVLALVPFLLCFLIAWLDRSWFEPMLSHPYGRGCLAGCAAVWLAATLWAHQIVGAEL